jgi:hypothetical protein
MKKQHEGDAKLFGDDLDVAKMAANLANQEVVAPDDPKRLAAQMAKVTAVMADGEWRTLEQLATAVGAETQSVSARLRDLRKPRYGSRVVERAYAGGGLYRYRLVITDP